MRSAFAERQARPATERFPGPGWLAEWPDHRLRRTCAPPPSGCAQFATRARRAVVHPRPSTAGPARELVAYAGVDGKAVAADAVTNKHTQRFPARCSVIASYGVDCRHRVMAAGSTVEIL